MHATLGMNHDSVPRRDRPNAGSQLDLAEPIGFESKSGGSNRRGEVENQYSDVRSIVALPRCVAPPVPQLLGAATSLPLDGLSPDGSYR